MNVNSVMYLTSHGKTHHQHTHLDTILHTYSNASHLFLWSLVEWNKVMNSQIEWADVRRSVCRATGWHSPAPAPETARDVPGSPGSDRTSHPPETGHREESSPDASGASCSPEVKNNSKGFMWVKKRTFNDAWWEQMCFKHLENMVL